LFTDPDAAEAYLLAEAPRNTSPPLHAPIDDLPDDVLQQIHDREWFFFDHLGYPRITAPSQGPIPPSTAAA
jgi:hypothetical protein